MLVLGQSGFKYLKKYQMKVLLQNILKQTLQSHIIQWEVNHFSAVTLWRSDRINTINLTHLCIAFYRQTM